jgi:alpha-beta hydrolase superfamily lysophospholipase
LWDTEDHIGVRRNIKPDGALTRPGRPGEIALLTQHVGDKLKMEMGRPAPVYIGVTDPGNLPFMLRPQEAKTVVLLVHGFTGTPWEMRPLGDFLAAAGIASLAVRLPGHGTTPEDLAGRRWQEWLRSVEHGYQVLSEEFPSVFGMGMSTGCLLLLAAAASKRFNGLVLFSPYLRILHKLAPYAWWFSSQAHLYWCTSQN